jgi:hypothetical protein
VAKKKAIKSVWSRVSARLKRGPLKARPLLGRARQINPELPSRRSKNLHPLSYATLQRVLKAGSKSAKPFANRMPRLVKKVKPYGIK